MKIFSGKKENQNKTIIENIILENYNRYYRLAYQYAHNEEDACDIVQNGALNALKNSHSLKKTEYADTWIYRIMLNECFRFVKRPKHFSYEAVQEAGDMKAGYMEDAYANVDLQRAVDLLPEKYRAIVILKYFEDRTLEEIADILDENVNTVKSRLYRCMKKMRKSLSDNKGDNRYNLNSGIGG